MKKSRNKIHYYNFGKFRLDVTNRELLKDGKHVRLTQKSFELLEFLIENRGRSLRKNEILNDIWTENFVEEANLAQHIYMVRKVLKDNGDTETFIETIPKYGYRFIGEVVEEFADPTLVTVKKNPLDSSKPETNGFHLNNQESVSKVSEEDSKEEESNKKATPSPIPIKKTNVGKWAVILGTIAVLLSIATYFWFNKATPISNVAEIKSIAILPFSQIGDAADQKLGLGYRRYIDI